jgi:hypothetical protein
MATTATDLAELAPLADEHLPFVTCSWRGSGLPGDTLRLLQRRPGLRLCVARVAGSPDDLIGWAASLDGVLVYAYTRFHLRRNGYAGRAFCFLSGLFFSFFLFPVAFFLTFFVKNKNGKKTGTGNKEKEF